MNRNLHNFTKHFVILFLVAIAGIAYSQDLPNYMTEQEKLLMPEYLRTIDTKGITTPPASPVRAMAEWEEVQCLVITWTSDTSNTSILTEIVRAARLECRVYIVCSDSSSVRTKLTARNVPLSNVKCVIAPFNTIWIRDYFANPVYTHDVDSLLLSDWVYNRPRPKDDTVCRVFGRMLNIPVYQMTNAPYKLVATGGDHMSDGFGNAFSEHLILDENGTGGGYNQNLTEADVDTIMKKFMGTKRYKIVTNLPYDGIHHIDMHAKLLDEETLLVGQYPQGIADGPQIEANLQSILSTCNSVFGTPYNVVRIPMPPDNMNGNQYPNQYGDYLTYSNGVFVNKTYIFPTYYQKYDTTATRILKEALPGYKVVGINCNDIIPMSGAIHCITHTIGVTEPLLISHQRLKNTYNTSSPYDLTAKILTKSGVQSATVYYRADTTQAYLSVVMALTDVSNNIWSAQIPAQLAGTNVYYYIHAVANSGKTLNRPLSAPAGYYKFRVIGTVGINEIANNIEIYQPFPNPTKKGSLVYLPIESPLAIYAEIELVDMLGQPVKSIYIGKLDQGRNLFTIDMNGLSEGVYTILIKSANTCKTKRIIQLK